MGVYIDTTGWSILEDATTASGILWIDDSICFVVPERTKIIPDHGDLLDKDELSRLVGESFEYFVARLGLKCPKAVIPAERSEE